MRLTDGTARARLTLVVDLLALGLFALVGMRSHDVGSAVAVFARNAVPFGVAWIAFSAVLRTYRPPAHRSLIWTIVTAIPAGALGRTVWVGSPRGVRILVFLGVALLFVSLFVGTGRVVSSLLARRLAWQESR